jgi:hypothetical protein
MSCYK